MKAQSGNNGSRDLMEPQDFIELAEAIERALVRFESTSNHAVLRIYRKGAQQPGTSNFRGTSPDMQSSVTGSHLSQNAIGVDNGLLTEDENEHVFLVYLCVLPSALHIIRY